MANTEAQRLRDARKRAKLRAKRRGDSPNLTRVTLSTTVYCPEWLESVVMHCCMVRDSWAKYKAGGLDDPFDLWADFPDDACTNGKYPGVHWKKCFRFRTASWLYTGHDVTRLNSLLEAYYECYQNDIQSLQADNSTYLEYLPRGFKHQWKEHEEIKSADVTTRVRIELTVERGELRRSHVWQDVEIGTADVTGVLATLVQSLNPAIS